MADYREGVSREAAYALRDGPAYFEGPQLVSKSTGKTISSCASACTAPVPRNMLRTLADLADFFLSPMVPGPLYVAGLLPPPGGVEDAASEGSDRHGRQEWDRRGASSCPVGRRVHDAKSVLVSEDAGRLERLWELRLCIEHLRDCIESYDLNGERDSLSTAEETLEAIDDILRRVAVLGATDNSSGGHAGGSGREASRGRRASSFGVADMHMDAQLFLEAIGAQSVQPGALTECLLTTRLFISGLLEAVLGELTDWQSRPSDSDLSTWHQWDQTYERIAMASRRLPGAWQGSPLLDTVCCRQGTECTSTVCGSGLAIAERRDAPPPICGALCRA